MKYWPLGVPVSGSWKHHSHLWNNRNGFADDILSLKFMYMVRFHCCSILASTSYFPWSSLNHWINIHWGSFLVIKLIEARVLERRILRRLRNKQAFSETDKNNEMPIWIKSGFRTWLYFFLTVCLEEII